MKKNLFCLFVMALFTFGIVSVCYADWVQEGTNWQYENNGSIIKNDFKNIDGKYYYFDDNGNMATSVIELADGIYAYHEDGTSMYDTGIDLFDKHYKVTLKGKIMNIDDDYSIEDIKNEIASKKLQQEKTLANQNAQAIQQSALSQASTEVEGWNKINGKYRYAISLNDQLTKSVHKYQNYNLPSWGTTTFYFDDNGDLCVLDFEKNNDGGLTLKLAAGQAEYTESYIYIDGTSCQYDYKTKTIRPEDVYIIEDGGFKIDTYKQDFLNDFEIFYNQQLALAAQKAANEEAMKKQAVLDELAREKAQLEAANRLKIDKTTEKIETISYTDNDDKKHNMMVVIKVPVMVGTNSDKLNAVINEKYVQTLLSQYSLDLDGLDNYPKKITVSNVYYSDEGNGLVLFTVSSNIETTHIYYNINTTEWYVADKY